MKQVNAKIAQFTARKSTRIMPSSPRHSGIGSGRRVKGIGSLMGDERKVQLLDATLGGMRASRRYTVVASAAALVFAAIAAGALYAANEARRAERELQRQLTESQHALDDAAATVLALTSTIAQTAQANPHADNVEAVRDLTRRAIALYLNPSSEKAAEQRARALLALAEIDAERGWTGRTQEDAEAALVDLDRLDKAGNLEARHLHAQAERLIGASYGQRGDYEDARRHYQRGIGDLDELLKRNSDPDVAWRWMRSLARLHQAYGDLLLDGFDQSDDALAAYNKSRELLERLITLGHQGPAFEVDLAWIISRHAEVAERKGDIEDALALSTEALERMENLKDGIWDNLRWAADYGEVTANIARLKRKQKRYAEAAPIFARAEEIIVAVTKRDPKNRTRAAALNSVRFLRAENLFRLGVQNNDRVRLLSAREQTQAIIASTTALLGDSAKSSPMHASKVRAEAFLAAIDATLRQINGNYDSAAAGYLEASDIIAKGYLADGKRSPSADLVTENIEYLEWAGAAYVKGQKPSEAQTQFRRAAEMLEKYRPRLNEKLYEDLRLRIDARIDHGPAAVGGIPQAGERASASPDRTPPLIDAPSATEATPPPAPDNAPATVQVPAAETAAPRVDGSAAPASPAPSADPALSAGEPVSPPQQ